MKGTSPSEVDDLLRLSESFREMPDLKAPPLSLQTTEEIAKVSAQEIAGTLGTEQLMSVDEVSLKFDMNMLVV
jgi:hypothetical protein